MREIVLEDLLNAVRQNALQVPPQELGGRLKRLAKPLREFADDADAPMRRNDVP